MNKLARMLDIIKTKGRKPTEKAPMKGKVPAPKPAAPGVKKRPGVKPGFMTY